MSNACLQIVGHEYLRNASQELEGPHVSCYPVGKLLRNHRLCVGVAGKPQGGYEDVCSGDLPRFRIDDGQAIAGKVHKELLARPMKLAHGWFQLADPAPVEVAEPRVGVVALGVLPYVLLPDERKGYVL